MEVNCEGCAGCCLDWRPLLAGVADDEPRIRSHGPAGDLESDSTGSSRRPLDGDPNFVPLTRDEVREFLEDGMAAALTPRFWHASDESEGVEIDGYSVAALAGRPAFFVGLRKPPKPVAPFGREEPAWLPTCVFLDPETLQCRVHEDDRFPSACRSYPAHNLALEQETECERVESTVGDEARLLEDDVDTPEDLLLGREAIGEKLFCHPRPDDLEGTIGRLADGTLEAADCAECLAVAAASSPGTIATSVYHYERAKARTLETIDADESWVGPAIREWHRRDGALDASVAELARAIETDRGAPETPGWDT